jgi:hypothetical protein
LLYDVCRSTEPVTVINHFSYPAVATSAPSSFSIPQYLDNCCSFSTTPDTSVFTVDDQGKPLLTPITPFSIGGIAGSTLATHMGDIAGLPSQFRKAFYAPKSTATLYSLGYFNSLGASYAADSSGALTVWDAAGHPFIKASRAINNIWNMPPAPLSAFIGAAKLPFDTLANPGYPQVLTGNPQPERFTREQLRRCDQVQNLLDYFHLPGDETLSDTLHGGSLGTKLARTDVQANRAYRGRSPNFLAGHMINVPMPPSDHPPAVRPGQWLSMDAHELPCPSPGGNTHYIAAVDEHSGATYIQPSKSKSMADFFVAAMTIIRKEFNAFGWKCDHIHSDSESVFRFLIPAFGACGILLTMSPPGQHAQRIERYTRTLGERERSTRDRLPFVIDKAYDIYLISDIAQSHNLLVNSQSAPLTPEERVRGSRPVFHKECPFLPFGTTCFVKTDTVKQTTMAKSRDTKVKASPVGELGVNFGRCSHIPGSYWFLVHSGAIVPRRVFDIVNVLPFGWQPKSQVKIIQAPQPDMIFSELNSDNSDSVPVDPTLSAQRVEQSAAVTAARSGDISPLGNGSSTGVVSSSLPLAPTLTGASGLQSPTTVSGPAAILPLVHVPPSSPVSVVAAEVVQESLSTSLADIDVPPSPLTSLAPLDFAPTPPRVARVRRSRNVWSPGAFSAVLPTQSQLRTARAHSRYVSELDRNEQFWSDIEQHILPPVIACPAPVPLTSVFASRLKSVGALLLLLTIGGVNSSAPPPMPHATLYEPATAFDMQDYTRCVADPVGFKASSGFVPSPDYLPSFSPRPMKEMPARVARVLLDPDLVAAAEAVEINKLLERFSACVVIDKADIQPNATVVYARFLYKEKHEDANRDIVTRVSARLALDGTMQPEGSYGETNAPTADPASRLVAMAALQAHAIQHGYIDRLVLSSFDVAGAFLHVPLVSPVQIVFRMPPGINHPSAGCWMEVKKSIYGLKQSNNAFDADLRAVILSCGFRETLDPCIYVRRHHPDFLVDHPDRVNDCCILSTHVDDGQSMCTYEPFWTELIATLEARYGPVSTSVDTDSYAGIGLSRNSAGAITLSQRGFIMRLLDSLGMSDVDPSSTPSGPGLFHPSTDPTPVDLAVYSKLIGVLIWLMQTKFEIHKEVVHLAGKCSSPTQGDVRKVVQVLRYLQGSKDTGPTYYTTEGPILVAHADAAYGVHTDGRSQSGFYLSIGRYSAPVFVYTGAQRSCVALGSMHAEYVVLAEAGKKILEYRYFLEDIGFPQQGPTPLYEDNLPAINLAVAPNVTRKSRHIHIRHHFIRDLVDQGFVKLYHLPSYLQTADLLTKPLGPTAFYSFRDLLLNASCRDVPGLPSFPSPPLTRNARIRHAS